MKTRNSWKRATYILVIICLFLVLGNVYQFFASDKVLMGEMCYKIEGTPAWIDSDGMILGYGYQNFGNVSWRVVPELIQNKIYFLYHPSCSVCKNQIEYFGTLWGEYVDSGFAIDCVKYAQENPR